MNRRNAVKGLALIFPSIWLSQSLAKGETFLYPTASELKIADGPFAANWKSLQQYQTPEWYQNAKFGIWAHWGPQCQPERGDWYARGMYDEGSDQYNYHVAKYGHPSKAGFKEVINEFKAEKWDPEELVSLYKNAGAEYFMVMANHHDNFDLYKSTYQPWNSTKLGPKKDIVGGWAKAAKKYKLRFGVSVHASHAWRFYETAQFSDKKGDKAGVPYDGKLTKADGKGTWWEGFDPQDLYAQNHEPSADSENISSIHRQWNWGGGVTVPSKAYCDQFLNRTIELINKYEPDVIYFDDTALPLWPISDAGLKIAAHFYNKSIRKYGKLEAVINGKILDAEQRKCMVWDIEKGRSNEIEPYTWQTDTCIGSWHYDRRIFEKHRYKSAKKVIHSLVDVVSKNGNLVLNIPVRGDGTIDSDERLIVGDITKWMAVNKESIFGTRPWVIFGEGPAMSSAPPLTAQGFNEDKGIPFTAEDIRFVKKGTFLYATTLGIPGNSVLIKSLATNSAHLSGSKIKNVTLLGHGNVTWTQAEAGLKINMPENKPTEIACGLRIELGG